MIYKFISEEYPDCFVEFFKSPFIENKVTIQVTDEEMKTIDIDLSKDQLFELIGGLLRIQSKMKGGDNGRG